MKLNIKRFAGEPTTLEVDVRTEYQYNSRMYVNSCMVILMGSQDLSAITDQNNRDVTEEWHISGNMGWKNITTETHDNLRILSEQGQTDTVNIDIDGFTPESELYRPEINGDIKIKNSNTKMKNVADVVENYFDELYPVGSVYKTTSNSIPFSKGTWSLIKTEPDRNYIGSQVIHTGTSGSTTVGKTSLYGAYSYRLIDGVFGNLTIPSGYHREYRLTFQGTTGGNAAIKLYINNIATGGVQTWSGNTFRCIGGSNYFKESDIVLETTYQYSQSGTNLKYEVTGSATSWEFKNATIHGYITSDTIYYYWKRTA